MEFKDLLDSPLFFNVFIKNDTLFNSLKEKFPDILADLTSSRNNPNCSCKNRVKSYLDNKIKSEKDYFNNLVNIDEIKSLVESKEEELKNAFPQLNNSPFPRPTAFKTNYPAIFEIGKSEEDWKNFGKKLNDKRFNFKYFSIIEKNDKLIVYFL